MARCQSGLACARAATGERTLSEIRNTAVRKIARMRTSSRVSIITLLMAVAPGSRVGVYEVTAQVGAGAMGVVFRGRDTKLLREVALKVLPEHFADDPDRLARLQREAQLLATLNHPNVAHVYGLEQADGAACIAMEFVDGETLADKISRGPIPLDEAVPIAKQMAEALAAAHQQG